MIEMLWLDVVFVFLAGAGFSLWLFIGWAYATGRILRGRELAIVQTTKEKYGLSYPAARKLIINEYARLTGERAGEQVAPQEEIK